MRSDDPGLQWIDREARSLRTRVLRVRPFALTTPMLPAAAVSPGVLSAIESHLRESRGALVRRVGDFLDWLRVSGADAALAHRRFSMLRLAFQNLLSRFDIFADALVQRSEHDTGVWISGLDAAARDALHIDGYAEAPPPVLCYLDRGHGGAIRRLRARLPGRVPNPVALIRLPRERMIGSGVAASLTHEAGHQVSATLNLEASLRPLLRAMRRGAGSLSVAWELWERWISEVVSDFWAVAKVGVAATQGLMAMLSLPRVFVFHTDLADPHPTPWIRAKLSCAIGDALHPDPQWARLAAMWDRFLPLDGVDPSVVLLLRRLERTLPAVASLLAEHRPPALKGRTLREASGAAERAPAKLRAIADGWTRAPGTAAKASPTLALATLGQARLDRRMSAEAESGTLETLLRLWALDGAWNTATTCSALM